MTLMNPLIVIVGPTAVGKTALSISLAKAFNGEIISGDSMQVYRGMDVGTAKIKAEEMNDIPHHLIDILEPNEPFSVADFQTQAKKAIRSVQDKGKIPFLAGGTGLYVNAVMYDYQFSQTGGDEGFRAEMEAIAEKDGNEALHARLKKVDPVSFKELHPNNLRRVIRALEVFHMTGKPLREDHSQRVSASYDAVVIGLTMERTQLYERINRRVNLMVEDGLVEEVRKLYEAGYADCQSMQAIGYKEITAFLRGEATKEEAVELLKRNSRRFAKRQLTWFRNKMDIHWFEVTHDREEREEEIHKFLAGKLF